jgi:hypothetical protein
LKRPSGPAQAMAPNAAAGGRTQGTGRGQVFGARPWNTVPPSVPRRSTSPSARRTWHPAVAWWADPSGTRTPGRTAAPVERARRCTSPGPPIGGGDERPLNPWPPPRGEDPLARWLQPPWGATHGRQDAAPENACGEPRIPCLLGARRAQSPRARLGQRRTRGREVVSPSRFRPPGAAPASGRAAALRSDAPGGC